MKQNYIKELINYHKDIKNNFWAGLIVSAGGTLSLTFTPINMYKIILLGFGAFFFIVFLNGYFNHLFIINKLLKELKEEEEKNG